ncbi:MAG: GAF domain-containing protein [Candidatus Riflebacteria bacterium]|nr:GAF domain-containing protein [Candidatus Riflebacteria bacterium]
MLEQNQEWMMETKISQELTQALASIETSRFDPDEMIAGVAHLSVEEKHLFLCRIFEILKERNTLLEVNNDLGRRLELGPLIKAIITHITDILKADRSSLFLIDHQTGELYSKVAQGVDFSEIRFPITVGLAGYVARTGETLNIEDAYQHPLFNQEIDKKTRYRTRTMLCMPIVNRENVIIGVVQVINKHDGFFHKRDGEVLNSLARMLSLTLENAILYERVTNSQRKIEALLNVANALSSSLDLKDLIKIIMSKAAELLNADRSTLFLIDRETDELWSSVASGNDVKEIRFPKHLGIAGQVAVTGHILNIPDAYEFPGFNRDIDKKTGYRTRSILCMPIKGMDNQVIGVTQIINKIHGTFDRTDEEMLGAFSAQAAVSLENAQLYEKTMTMKKYLEAILSSLSNGVITLDHKRRIVRVNPVALRILGLESEGDALGRILADIFGESNKQLVQEVEHVFEKNTQNALYDIDFKSTGEEKHSINFITVPLADDRGTSLGVVIVLEDITKEKRVKSNLTRYMSKDLVDKLTSGSGAIELGGARREVTILFSDIRGYTSLTEKLGPSEIVEMLNEYFTHMVDAIFKFDGVLDKFIGDAMMAVFGAPVPLPDHAMRSVQAALEMKFQLARFNKDRIARGKIPIQIGIGISTGEVLCGNIGSNKRMEYTAIGDGVNLSSRLESATKLYRAMTLLSEFTYEQIKGRVFARELDFIRVKGKNKPVRIYELLGEANCQLEDNVMRSIDAFIKGHEFFFQRNFGQARLFFERALQENPQDLPSSLYLNRCKACLLDPPSASWDGVYDLKEK